MAPGRIKRTRLYMDKWRQLERNSLPWNRLRIHREFLHREAFVRWPVQGNILQGIREGRIEIGKGVLFEPYVWITVPSGTLRIGAHTSLNIGVMVWVIERVEIGEHCMFANGCFISDAHHRFEDPVRPVPWQGNTSKGPTIIGDNVWCGVNVAILSGVTVGDRCVIGSNSVVTDDLPPRSVAVGAPARVVREIEYAEPTPT